MYLFSYLFIDAPSVLSSASIAAAYCAEQKTSKEHCSKNLFPTRCKRGFTRHSSLIKLQKNIQSDRRKIHSAPSSPTKQNTSMCLKDKFSSVLSCVHFKILKGYSAMLNTMLFVLYLLKCGGPTGSNQIFARMRLWSTICFFLSILTKFRKTHSIAIPYMCIEPQKSRKCAVDIFTAHFQMLFEVLFTSFTFSYP